MQQNTKRPTDGRITLSRDHVGDAFLFGVVIVNCNRIQAGHIIPLSNFVGF
jgi:hypothetical protein